MPPFKRALPPGSVPRFWPGKRALELKLPARMAAVGRGRKLDPFGKVLLRKISSLKKKKVLFLPLYTFGIHTGPPMVPPKSFLRLRGLVEGTVLVKYGRRASRSSFVRYS